MPLSYAGVDFEGGNVEVQRGACKEAVRCLARYTFFACLPRSRYVALGTGHMGSHQPQEP